MAKNDALKTNDIEDINDIKSLADDVNDLITQLETNGANVEMLNGAKNTFKRAFEVLSLSVTNITI